MRVSEIATHARQQLLMAIVWHVQGEEMGGAQHELRRIRCQLLFLLLLLLLRVSMLFQAAAAPCCLFVYHALRLPKIKNLCLPLWFMLLLLHLCAHFANWLQVEQQQQQQHKQLHPKL